MITIERNFNPMTDRYAFDFRQCTIAKGWAQLDTSQDASYFGQWVNPELLQILCYCEGDITLTKCETVQELAAEIAAIKRWNLEQGHRFLGIDPGFNEGLKARFVAGGMSQYFHGAEVIA